jgi:hypothetical protein
MASASPILNGFLGGPSGPFQPIVASLAENGGTSPRTGPYGLSALDLTPLGIAF